MSASTKPWFAATRSWKDRLAARIVGSATTSSNMGEAARILGLHRPNLYRKMKLLGLDGK